MRDDPVIAVSPEEWELPDAAIEALARLLLSVVDRELAAANSHCTKRNAPTAGKAEGARRSVRKKQCHDSPQ